MRAILLCAGMGTRLHPFTTQKHKSLLTTNGVPLIERTLNYLHSKNINDITIVVGHCAEQFDYLIEKFGVELRLSNVYQTHNNYSSMQLVLDKLEDAIVLEGDFYLIDDFIDRIDTTNNQYFSQKITHGLEWGLTLDSDDRILAMTPGISSGWGLIGISYWTGNMTSALAKELTQCTQNEYWDDAVMRLFQDYPVYANKVDSGVALEFDSVEDILFYNMISYEELVLWASDDGIYTKIDNNIFQILQNNKKQELSFKDNKLSIKEIL